MAVFELTTAKQYFCQEFRADLTCRSFGLSSYASMAGIKFYPIANFLAGAGHPGVRHFGTSHRCRPGVNLRHRTSHTLLHHQKRKRSVLSRRRKSEGMDCCSGM